MTAGAAELLVKLEAVGAVPHTAVVVAGAVGVDCAVVTHLALVSGRQDRRKAQCSCLGPSSKPHLTGTRILICSKGNNHYN